MYTLFRKSQFKNALPCSLGFRKVILLLLSICILLSAMPLEVQAAAGSYSLKWYAADPEVNKGPYLPTYAKITPEFLECSSLEDAVAYAGPVSPNNLDALTSLAPKDMMLGQIVPFEIEIQVNGDTTSEDGNIAFTGSWSTKTTSGNDFGYDTSYGVYCAFVDHGDPGTRDIENDAKVETITDNIVNPGTSNEQIQGTITVSGLDDGDIIIVEVWVVLKNTIPDKITGNVQSELTSANTTPSQSIKIGTQTVPLLQVKDFIGRDYSLNPQCNGVSLTVSSPFPNGMYLDMEVLKDGENFYDGDDLPKTNGVYIADLDQELSSGDYIVTISEYNAQNKLIAKKSYTFTLDCDEPEFPIGSFVVLFLAGVIYLTMRRKKDVFSNGKK